MLFWGKSVFANGFFQAVLSALPSRAFLIPSIKCFSTDQYWFTAKENKMDPENGVCMRVQHCGPDQIPSSPHQMFAQPLPFRRTQYRLLGHLAQKSRRKHLNTLTGGAVIVWGALLRFARHSLIKAVSVSINILEMLNGVSFSRFFSHSLQLHLLGQLSFKRTISEHSMRVAGSFRQDALKSRSPP